MTAKIRWGILGCGKVANRFASDLRLVKDAVIVAIASRDHERAKEFAGQFGAALIFHDYEALAASTEVDVIYVATPHGYHHRHVMLCLQHSKAVVCEKAFALNARQAREMIDLARQKKIFLMEAFWTKFLPQYKKIIELLDTNTIGAVKMIHADFGFCAPKPISQRLYDVELGGGSLLDIGIYPVFLAQSLFGKPVTVQASMTPYPSGVDEQCAMVMTFPEGTIALLSSTFAADTPVEAMILGTQGRIYIRNRFHNASAIIELWRDGEAPTPIDVYREDGYGYQFEAQHVCDCLQKGLTESPVMTHNDTLTLMETLDAIRSACGITYAVDEK